MRMPPLSTYEKVIAGSIVGAIMLIAIVTMLAHRRGIPAKDQHTLDSLQITKPIYDSTQRALAKTETTYVNRVDTLRIAVAARVAKASTLHARADSEAVVANHASPDSSAAKWHAAYDDRTREVVELRGALDSSTAQWDAEHQARIAADLRATNAATRLTASEDLNTRLAVDVKRASECRILFWNCPSRKEVAVVSIVSTALIAKYHSEIKKTIIP
jgi:hypothetical protein